MKSSPHRPSIELLFKRGLGSAEIARRLQISSSTPGSQSDGFQRLGHVGREDRVDDLKAALEVAWASIDDGYLRRTVNSVKKRLRACVKARGSNFEILL
uniref:HTH luxR-type domain-containing protein n=1 Tax=Caenorhabditis japonica TaxID=281687 RepID=A0A8R1EHL4_CAEJA